MSQMDELMKGFEVGYKNAPFAPLGNAIKSTLGRLTQQEDMTSGLVTKAGIEQMFQDPLDRQVKQAQLEGLRNKKWEPSSMEEALNYERAKAGIISPDEQLDRDKTDLEIKKLQQELGSTEQASQKEVDFIRQQASDNLNTVRKIKEGAKHFGRLGNLPTAATPNVFSNKEYGNRKVWENEIQKLLSQKVVDLITTMKSASKTGATGFGQLSEKEGQLLREASTALSRDLPPDKALYYLNEMERIYQKVLNGGGESNNYGKPNNPFVQQTTQLSDEEAYQEYLNMGR